MKKIKFEYSNFIERYIFIKYLKTTTIKNKENRMINNKLINVINKNVLKFILETTNLKIEIKN